MKILFLAANPSSTKPLKLGDEIREIEEGLRRSKLWEQFEIVQRWAVRPRDLWTALLEENPDLVHFSGHGEGKAGLVIVDKAGQAKPATAEALASLFKEFSSIKCVVLNACYAELQAEAIVQEIDYVIGMRDTILDDAAIAFSTGFYDGLGYGRNIEDAFKLGRNAILWEQASFSDETRNLIPVDFIETESSESLPEHLKPILLKKKEKENINPVNPFNNDDNTQIGSKNLQEYRERIREYLAEGRFNPLATFQLATLAQELKINQVEANKILKEELGKIEEPAAEEFYVERPPVEEKCYQEILKPGNLIRIKAPQKMGKTLLLNQILKHATQLGFKTVIFSFGILSDSCIYEDYEKLSQTFCFTVSDNLKFNLDDTENWLNVNWRTRRDTNENTTKFFQDYLLPEISMGLVLALENFDRVFENNHIRDNFCKLLRHWYDLSKRETSNIWEKLRLIIIHSTDVYGSMDINSSPLAGVGEDFELTIFNDQQIQELITKYNVTLNDNQRKKLIDFIGGHPYLLVKAIKALDRKNITLEILLEQAPTENGIFRNDLHQLMNIIAQNNDFKKAYKKVINSDTPVELLDPKYVAFKLQSLGLVQLEGDMASPSNNLYKEYFRRRLI